MKTIATIQSNTKVNRYALAAVLAGSLIPTALAQTGAPSKQHFALEEVVVTAQKREENLQNVPIAVTALSADTLEAFRVTQIDDLNGLAPNLRINNQGIQTIPSITIRGITSGVSDNAVDPTIGLYLNGVYIGRSVGAIFDLADIERIEILRGPQGTLFGRNATGGALSLTTAAPTGEFGLKQDISVGNNEAFRTRTNLNFPSMGPLSVKISYLHDENDGTEDNLIAGNTIDLSQRHPDLGVFTYADRLGSREVDAVLLAAQLALGESASADYTFDYTDSHTVAYPTQQLGIKGDTAPLLEVINSLQPVYGGITNLSTERLGAVASATSEQTLEIEGHNLTLHWDINRALNVKTITAYREMEQAPSVHDIAATGGWKFTQNQLVALLAGDAPALLAPRNAPGPDDSFFSLLTVRSNSQRQFSQEVQFTLSTDAYDLVAGAFYFEERSPALSSLGILQPVTHGLVVPSFLDAVFGSGTVDSVSDNDSRAVFAQGTWHASDKLDLTAGLRYTKDRREIELKEVAGGAGQLEPGTYRTDYGKTNYTLVANYALAEDAMAYARIASGFVAGGVMSGIPYDAEELVNYEVGFKSQLMEQRLRVNASAFFMDYTDMQVQSFIGGVQSFDNAGRAEISGMELEVDAMPLEGLLLQGTLGWTDFEYKEFIQGGVDITDEASRPYAPELNARLSAQYDLPLSVFGGSPYFRLDSRYTGDYDFELLESGIKALDELALSEAHWVLDARTGVHDIAIGNTAFSLSLWVKNLLNEDDVIQYGPTVINQTGQYILERTFGADISIVF